MTEKRYVKDNLIEWHGTAAEFALATGDQYIPGDLYVVDTGDVYIRLSNNTWLLHVQKVSAPAPNPISSSAVATMISDLATDAANNVEPRYSEGSEYIIVDDSLGTYGDVYTIEHGLMVLGQKTTDGATHVESQAGSVWSYGDWPATWWTAIEGTAANTSDGTIIYLSGDISHYNHHEISVIAGAGGAVNVTVSYDGANYYSTAVMLVDRSVATGDAAGMTTNIATLGNYYLKGKFKAIRIRQAGGAISTAYQVRGAHAVV